MGLVLFGKGTRAPMSLGLFGGYPGSNVAYSTFRRGNVDELPRSLAETSGESREDRFWGAVELEPGDIQYVRFMGGGGYGDPLDRDPDAVLADVRLGLVSEAAARQIYGVVVQDGVDDERTRARRLEIRSERLGRPVEWSASMRAEVAASGMRLSEYLQRLSSGETQCTFCATVVAPAGAEWKDHAVRRRSPLQVAGPFRYEGGEFVLAESFCPGCGTVLDVEIATGDDPPLHDRVVTWPEIAA
jgi:N-methylhydantoinase B